LGRANGDPLNFEGFKTFLFTIREKFSNRILRSQSAIVSPSDSSGLIGQVAHTSHTSGIQDGKNIDVTIVSILNVKLEKGERKIEMESFVLESTLQPVPASSVMGIQVQVSNAFHGILIQDNEDIFHIAYENDWSRHVVEK
jgi:hypothetical protein